MADWINILKGLTTSVINAEQRQQLIEAYNEALALSIRVRELDSENHELKGNLKFKENLTFKKNVLWAEGEQHPYCPACWQAKDRAVNLTCQSTQGLYRCPSCATNYRTQVLQ